MSNNNPQKQRSIDRDGIPLAGEGFVRASELPTESILDLDSDARSHYKAVLKQLRLLARATPNEQRQSALGAVIEDVESLFPEHDPDQLSREPIKHVERDQAAGTTVVVESRVYDDGEANRKSRELLAEETAQNGVNASDIKWDGEGDADAGD